MVNRLDDYEEDYAIEDEEIDIMADPTVWRPFPINANLLLSGTDVVGFRTVSGMKFGPERIEVRPDKFRRLWLYKFISYEHSVEDDRPTSQRAIHSKAKAQLDEYLQGLDDSLRSRCFNDDVFRNMTHSRFAMEVKVPDDCILVRKEFLQREELWKSFLEKKKVDWSVSPHFLIKLRNEGLEDLHKILQAPQLKPHVAKQCCIST